MFGWLYWNWMKQNQADAFCYLAIATTSPPPPSALSVSEPSMSLIPDDPWENSTLPATPSVEEVLLLGWQANTELRRSTKSLRRPCISSTSGGGVPENEEVFIGMWYTWRLSLTSSSPERDQLEDSSNSQQIWVKRLWCCNILCFSLLTF